MSASLVSMAFLNILNLRFILSLICFLIHGEDTLLSLLITDYRFLGLTSGALDEVTLPFLNENTEANKYTDDFLKYCEK